MESFGLNDEIETINGFNRLNFNLEPKSSIIIEPTTLVHMDGKLILEPTIFSQGGILSAFKRSITGQTVINEQITNKTNEKLKLSLCSPLLGSINKIEIKPNEIWRFTPSSFIASTNNIVVSANLNILGNIKAAFGGQDIIYVEISTYDENPGIVWISAHGALEKHEVHMGKDSQKLLINDGVFLGMLSEDTNKKINYWKNFIHISSANGFFKGILTGKSLMMSVEDKLKNAPNDTKCIIYTQSLNIRNFQNYIISYSSVNNYSSMNYPFFTGGNNHNKYQKYNNKLDNLINKV
jgi:uncharacterized protein (AIM24 family)